MLINHILSKEVADKAGVLSARSVHSTVTSEDVDLREGLYESVFLREVVQDRNENSLCFIREM